MGTDYEEKRQTPRIAMDADFCEVALPGGQGHLAIVRDISLGGVRVEFSSCDETSALCTGCPVQVRDLPEAWEGLAGKSFPGRMVWREGLFAGIAFSQPLPAETKDFWYFRLLQLDLRA